MDEIWSWYWDKKALRTQSALKARGFDASYFPTKEDVCKWLVEEAEEASTVGVGGSLTIRQLSILEELQSRGKRVLDHWNASQHSEVLETRHQHLSCDLFLASANAVTESGEIVNVDGAGNRVAATIFGPKKVILVAGVNKIVRDLVEARMRVQELVAPINARRLGLKTPCAESGRCTQCDSPQRICNVTVVLHRRPHFTTIKVALVGEQLGL
jgi:hypothetical protein